MDLDAVQDANSPFPLSISKSLKGMQDCFRMPFWRISVTTFPYQRSVIKAGKFIRDFGKKVILERQEAISQGEDTPPDILAHILSVKAKEPSITIEDMIDEFFTFFVGGG